MLEKVKLILKEAEDRETFLRRISSFLPPTDPRHQLIIEAYNDAKDAFRDIKRSSGQRYFEHLRGVFLIQFDYLRIRDHVDLIAGMMHDMPEDIRSWPIERVQLKYGNEVAMLVDYASKPSKEEYPDETERLAVYHKRFEYAPRKLWGIKLPDRLHNLLDMWSFSPEKIAIKIEETKRYYLPYAEKHGILIHELEEAISELENKLKGGAK
jgi:(p)ppGpp synthase/HD superfamily hydrolase